MSHYRNKQAANAETYRHFQDIVERAIQTREVAFGWVGKRFYQAYPGGRVIDYTSSVPPKEDRSNA